MCLKRRVRRRLAEEQIWRIISFRDTLRQPGLRLFLWTQFLGAFNDNLFKIVSVLAVHLVAAAPAGRELSIVSAVVILPFLLFPGHAGSCPPK